MRWGRGDIFVAAFALVTTVGVSWLMGKYRGYTEAQDEPGGD